MRSMKSGGERKVFPNLSEIVTTTLRNRTGALAAQMTRNNALLNSLLWDSLLWEPQKPGTVSLPDFIKLSAQGKARMKGGIVYLKTDGLKAS
jgi:hypothetical protein